jgi:hypothetical protein
MERYNDPADTLNGAEYQTGEQCIEGCGRPAGTAWSHLWCQPCNAKRLNNVSEGLESARSRLDALAQPKTGTCDANS